MVISEKTRKPGTIIKKHDLFGEMQLRFLDDGREESPRRMAFYTSSSTLGPHVNFDGHFQTHESDMEWWPFDFIDQWRTVCAAYDIDSNSIADEKSLPLLLFACEMVSWSSTTKHWMRRGRERREDDPMHAVLYGTRNKHSIVLYRFWQITSSHDIHVLDFGKISWQVGTCPIDVCIWEDGEQETP